MTRILNGCAEARTVGTHYSTTHPPPLSQNSTSSYRSFSFSFPPRLRRSRASLSLTLSLSFASRAPLPPLLSVAGSSDSHHHLRSPSRPLSLFLSAHPARHGEAVFVHTAHVLVALVCACHMYTHIRARARAHGTHSCSILFSFHLSFYPTLFSPSVSLCLSHLLLLRRFSAKRNPRM